VSSLPPGTFRIDREGVWRHEGQEVTHPGVLRNLYANLRAEGGAHYLQVGPARIPVEVADAPFVVIRVEIQPDAPESLWLNLSDGSQERLDPAGLWLGPTGAPYCSVKEGRFRARFSVPAWLQLAERLEGEPGGAPAVLVLGNRRISLTQRD
jgi:hypothetical protein